MASVYRFSLASNFGLAPSLGELSVALLSSSFSADGKVIICLLVLAQAVKMLAACANCASSVRGTVSVSTSPCHACTVARLLPVAVAAVATDAVRIELPTVPRSWVPGLPDPVIFLGLLPSKLKTHHGHQSRCSGQLSAGGRKRHEMERSLVVSRYARHLPGMPHGFCSVWSIL